MFSSIRQRDTDELDVQILMTLGFYYPIFQKDIKKWTCGVLEQHLSHARMGLEHSNLITPLSNT